MHFEYHKWKQAQFYSYLLPDHNSSIKFVFSYPKFTKPRLRQLGEYCREVRTFLSHFLGYNVEHLFAVHGG